MLPALLAVGAIAAVVLLLIGIFGQPAEPGSEPVSESTTTGPLPTTSATTTLPTTTTPATTTPPVTQEPIPDTPVIVLNSTDSSGLAARVAAYLGGLGWQVEEPGNFFPALDVTTVYYPDGQEAAARRLAAIVPGDTDTVSPTIPEVVSDAFTVVLGNDAADWVPPTSAPSTPPATPG